MAQRLVIAHLGNGAGITAVKAGQPIDTGMGMTPGGGVIMGTRSDGLGPVVPDGLDLLRQSPALGSNHG